MDMASTTTCTTHTIPIIMTHSSGTSDGVTDGRGVHGVHGMAQCTGGMHHITGTIGADQLGIQAIGAT